MDIQQITPQPMGTPMGGDMKPGPIGMQNKWWIWILAGVVVIAVLVWFLWQGTPSYGPGTATEDQQAEMLTQQSASDELSAIEQDVNATDLKGLDKELSDIKSQL